LAQEELHSCPQPIRLAEILENRKLRFHFTFHPTRISPEKKIAAGYVLKMNFVGKNEKISNAAAKELIYSLL